MSDDSHRKTILSRRASFIAAALASAGIGTSAIQACGGETDRNTRRGDAGDAQPQPCLDIAPDAEPQPCLGALPSDAEPPLDAEPRPCLKVALDASQTDAGAETDANGDAEPQPCLTPYY